MYLDYLERRILHDGNILDLDMELDKELKLSTKMYVALMKLI
jgi:hypothetical protein